ncbi:hypothetical protein B9479_003964 [Cryptococcus floricola]|uniref:BZIP domain-containing protein n=1 Tax=Cryptococcus floricola TaxID=2591691 RepID=A0A5D3AYK6_9TREE|nr:hypothetical protein B9479_003964 [Cryptococcus floricola]
MSDYQQKTNDDASQNLTENTTPTNSSAANTSSSSSAKKRRRRGSMLYSNPDWLSKRRQTKSARKSRAAVQNRVAELEETSTRLQSTTESTQNENEWLKAMIEELQLIKTQAEKEEEELKTQAEKQEEELKTQAEKEEEALKAQAEKEEEELFQWVDWEATANVIDSEENTNQLYVSTRNIVR